LQQPQFGWAVLPWAENIYQLYSIYSETSENRKLKKNVISGVFSPFYAKYSILALQNAPIGAFCKASMFYELSPAYEFQFLSQF